MRRDEDGDASRDAGFARDEAIAFEADDHLVDGRRGDPKIALHVGFGGWLAEDVSIDVDEGEVLALLFGEAMGAGATHDA